MQKSISSERPKLKSQDFAFLRAKGISLIQDYSGKSELWTDYNTHDPGISFLEAISYAITDSGLMAKSPESKLFLVPLANQLGSILNNNASNDFDLRKLILDFVIDNQRVLKNVWIEPVQRYSPSIYFGTGGVSYTEGALIPMRGGHRIVFDFIEENLNQNIVPYPLDADKTIEIAFPFIDELDMPAKVGNGFSLQSILIDDFLQTEGNEYAVTVQADYLQAGTVHSYTFNILFNAFSVELDTSLELLLKAKLQSVSDPDNPVVQFFRKIVQFNGYVDRIKASLSAHRPLAEDFFSFEVIRPQEIAMEAILDVQAGTNITALLAEIFFAIDQFLSPDIPIYDLPGIQEKEQTTLENILEGVRLQNGFIRDADLKPLRTEDVLYTSDLLNIIMQIREERGIINVREFRISNYVKNILITADVQNCLRLVQPDRYRPKLSIFKSNIKIYQNGQRLYYDLKQVRELFEEKKKEIQRFTASNAVPQISQEKMERGDYYSIQHEFPITYGIGKGDLAPNATPARKAQAKQLKGYLLPFEQLLAQAKARIPNGANADLYGVPDIKVLLSFFVETPDIDFKTFKQDGFTRYRQLLRGDVVSQLDHRESQLDHAISQFGEQLANYRQMMASLYPADFLGQLQLKQKLVKDKQTYLAEIGELGRNRGAGYNYRKKSNNSPDVWDTTNIGGYAKRIARLLGIQNSNRRSLSEDVAADSHLQRVAMAGGQQGLQLLKNGNLLLESLTPRTLDENQLKNYRDAMLYYGAHPYFYRSQYQGDQVYAVLVDAEEVAIARTPPFDTAFALTTHLEKRVIPQLEKLIAATENRGEGLYVVEHILLRPLKAKNPRGRLLYNGQTPDPYSSQITVVLPSGWKRRGGDEIEPSFPARFRDFADDYMPAELSIFKQYAEQLIRRETPAHILANVVWLDQADFSSAPDQKPYLQEFERIYKAWLEVKASADANTADKQDKLNDFLRVLNRALQYGLTA